MVDDAGHAHRLGPRIRDRVTVARRADQLARDALVLLLGLAIRGQVKEKDTRPVGSPPPLILSPDATAQSGERPCGAIMCADYVWPYVLDWAT